MQTENFTEQQPSNNRWKHYAIGLVAIAFITLAYALWAHYQADTTGSNNLNLQHNLDSLAGHAQVLTNENGQLVTDNIGLKAQHESELKELSASYFNLRGNQEKLISRVNYLTVLRQLVRHDSIFIRYDTSQHIPLIARGRSDSIGVPQPFAYTDSFSAIYGRILKTGLSIDSSQYAVETYLRHGVRKRGFLNLGREDFVQAISPMSNVRITGLSTMTYKQRPSAWNRWIKPGLAGIAGAAATYYIAK